MGGMYGMFRALFPMLLYGLFDSPLRIVRFFESVCGFLFSSSRREFFLVEINSTVTNVWPPDLILMLLSGASVVRFANEYLERFRTKKQFVLVAMFIQQNGEATLYLLYQLENDLDQAVCCAFNTS